ncbi:methionyl-tRNA formyltransferase [Stieleria neptunia]|uniref:methionyl-tRNA formyltransferase n=1 Tax=Stieleria neptunia TaxID=2527979 RepID=UPI0018D23EF5|nr:formyltransferase family protein [Stieleria neptunia]
MSKYRFLKDHPSEIEILQLSSANNVRTLTAPSINSDEFRAELLDLAPDILLIASWAEIIKQPTLSTGNHRVINCHGSLLPKYRGACPQIATIFNGDKKTGITFHLIDEGIDTGDILLQKELEVGPGETSIRLEERIASQFSECVVDLLRGFQNGSIAPKKQAGDASYVPKLSPSWSWIPWEARPAEIDRRMRALDGILPLATSLGQLPLAFEKGSVVDSSKALIKGNGINLFQIRDRLRPGTVLAVEPDKLFVCTQDSDSIVELSTPALVQSGKSTPSIRPGEHFVSFARPSILKSA